MVLAADDEERGAGAVDTHLESMRAAETADVIVEIGLELDSDRVFAVHRKRVSDGKATARAERQVVAQPGVLNQQTRNGVGLARRTGQRPPQRLTGDFFRRGHVPVEQRGRHRQHLGDVVEPVLVGIVGRKQRADVGVDAEEIADRVGVLGAVQAMHGGTTRVHVERRRPVERGFETGDERRGRRRIGPRSSDRRHRPSAELPHHLFPLLRVGADLRQIRVVERQAGRLQPLVMAGHAVAGEKLAVGGRLRRRRRRLGQHKG